ncbi:MAG: hypothetical protein AAGA02_08590 [Bacteroidota bacterium]
MKYFFILCVFFGLFLSSCEKKDSETQRNSQELSYYANGNIKFECNLKDSLRNGVCKGFYENGNIKYAGEFKGGLMNGSHREFYENDSGKVHYEQVYEIREQESLLLRSRSYDTSGLVTFDSRYIDAKEVKILGVDSVFQNDSLKLKLQFVEPKYEFIRAYTGDINKQTREINKESILHYNGEDQAVSIMIMADKPGWNQVRGYLVDFTIQPVGDSTYIGMRGVERGESTYFEYNYYVVPQSEI